MGVNIHFLGAADTVTGSKFLIEHEDQRVLIDCGLRVGELKKRLQTCDLDVQDLDAVFDRF